MATIIATVRETEGTVTYLRPDYPIAGVSALASFTDDASGTGSYTKTFRYSKDGVQYSDWMPLTNPNLAAITFDQWDIFVVELAYDSSTGTGLTVSEATITGTIVDPDDGPIFAKSIFARLLTEYDPEVIGWYVNVVNKLYGRGLIAKYIQKTNINGVPDDFIAYWSAIAKFFAYFVVYARRYQDMFNNSDLLAEFLRERGLAISIHDTLMQLQTIAKNYYAEMMKRGTIQIISENNAQQIFGELLRLIYYVSTDEFMFNLYRSQDFGWNMHNSSPLYRGLAWNNENVNKYKEYNLTTGRPAPRVKVSPNLPYEICFFYRAPTGASVYVSLNAWDTVGSPVTMINANNGTPSNTFLRNFFPEDHSNANCFYRMIIYPAGTTPSSLDKTNLNNGNNLIFAGNENYIQPVLQIQNPGGAGPITPVVDLHFMKIFPLVTDYSRGFIQVNNFISCWLLNNNKNYTLKGLEAFIKRYLIPYDAYIKITEIDDSDSGATPPPVVVMPTISKAVTPGPYNLGDTITYTLTIDNSASSTNFFGCTITDQLPVGVDYTLFVPAVASYNTGTRTATWVLDVLAGAVVTIQIQAILHGSGDLTNSAYSVTPPGYDAITGPPVTIHVNVPVTINKTVVTPGPYSVGQTIVYQIAVTNSSTNTLSGVTVTDHLDLTKVTMISDSPIQPVTTGGDIIWTGVTLGPLSITLFSVTVKIIAGGANTNTYNAQIPGSTGTVTVTGTPVTITAVTIPNPPVLTDLCLALFSDYQVTLTGSDVTAWKDGIPASASYGSTMNLIVPGLYPKTNTLHFGGKQGIFFPGSGSTMLLKIPLPSLGGSQECTVFIVCHLTHNTSGAPLLCGYSGAFGSSPDPGGFFVQQNISDQMSHQSRDAGFNSGNIPYNVALDFMATYGFKATNTPASARTIEYINNSSAGYVPSGSTRGTTPLLVGGTFQIGSNYNQTLGCVLVYKRLLSNVEMTNTWNYLQAYFSL